MKQPKSYDYDELGRFRDWAEAEYCQRCGGRGEVPDPPPIEPQQSVVVAWARCPACHGTGRA